MTQIGEYVKRLSSDLKERYKEIDWKGIAGMRDIIVHRYASVDMAVVRTAILDDVPILKDACITILKDLDPQ